MLVGFSFTASGAELVAASIRYSASVPPGSGASQAQLAVMAWPQSPAGPPIGARGVVLQPGFLPGFPCFDSDYDGLPDNEDGDDDQDGVPDMEDTRPWDTDGDGVNNIHDPDADNDGQHDGQELTAGTDPVDPRDWFHVQVFNRIPGTQLELRWQGVAGRRYELLGAPDPARPGEWSSLGTRQAFEDVVLRLRVVPEQRQQVMKLEVTQP